MYTACVYEILFIAMSVLAIASSLNFRLNHNSVVRGGINGLPSLTRNRLFLERLKLTITDLHNGVFLEIDKTPYEIVEFQHVQPGRLSAFTRTKLRNLLKGTIQEKTFRAGDRLTEASVEKATGQFSYFMNDEAVFYDIKTSEEYRASKKVIGDKWNFLKNEFNCLLVIYGGEVVSISLPANIAFSIASVEENQSGRKATTDTGLEVIVPAFISPGDNIMVCVADGKYMGKA